MGTSLSVLCSLPRVDLIPRAGELETKPGEAFTLRLRLPSDPHRIGLNWVYVDPATARVLRVDRFDRQPLGVKIVRLVTPLHYGAIGGLTTRILWVVTGLMPGVFFFTSLLMWWNRVLSKKWRRRAPPIRQSRTRLRHFMKGSDRNRSDHCPS